MIDWLRILVVIVNCFKLIIYNSYIENLLIYMQNFIICGSDSRVSYGAWFFFDVPGTQVSWWSYYYHYSSLCKSHFKLSCSKNCSRFVISDHPERDCLLSTPVFNSMMNIIREFHNIKLFSIHHDLSQNLYFDDSL